MLYQSGYGFVGNARDYDIAFDYYNKSANGGHAIAYRDLGIMHEFGLGTEQNYLKAKECYEKGSAAGEAACQRNLALMYMFGCIGDSPESNLGPLPFEDSITQAAILLKQAIGNRDSYACVYYNMISEFLPDTEDHTDYTKMASEFEEHIDPEYLSWAYVRSWGIIEREILFKEYCSGNKDSIGGYSRMYDRICKAGYSKNKKICKYKDEKSCDRVDIPPRERSKEYTLMSEPKATPQT